MWEMCSATKIERKAILIILDDQEAFSKVQSLERQSLSQASEVAKEWRKGDHEEINIMSR